MIHLAPTYSLHSDRMSLPTHRSTAPPGGDAPVGARSWFETDPGTLQHNVKSHLVGMAAEFIGTTLFLFFALGGAQVASTAATSVAGGTQRSDSVDSVAAVANTSNLLYIAFSFGLSLAVSVWIFAPLSGGLLNPAVSLGLVVAGVMKPLRAVLLTVAQICGGMAASGLVYGLLPGGFDVRTTLSSETSIVRGLFIETLLTMLLMLTILWLAVEKNEAAPVAALGIGLSLFVAELVGVNFTGGSLNPARSFGPSLVARHFSGYFWIYVVGPFLGAIIAAGLYRFFKLVDYEACLKAHSIPSPVKKPLAITLDTASADLPPPSPSFHRPSVVSLEKTPSALRSVASASTLSPGQLDRIELMLGQLLKDKDSTAKGVAAA
ncbi:hypothetical protein JCM10207_006896 [Rhodosporidiobolus poonsookiae]